MGAVLDRLAVRQRLQDSTTYDGGAAESQVVPETDMSGLHRSIWVVTTASLPWRTGTAVNPLLRAAYLTRGRARGSVTLMLPWVELSDQKILFPVGQAFLSPASQEEHVRGYLAGAGLVDESNNLGIVWYDARYVPMYGSIFPLGDITQLVPNSLADICIMEEPEHLNWFRATGNNWTRKFKHVVGVIHTNYVYYAASDREHWGGSAKGTWMWCFNKLMIRAYCDKVIKLSATLQVFAHEKEVVCNVNGVRPCFLEAGHAAVSTQFSRGAYFLGKMLWEKGFDRLWMLMAEYWGITGECFPLDVYGCGPEKEEIQAAAQTAGLDATFHAALDHACLTDHKVFVNPSKSEVLCTATSEALAMGKFVVIARHPSNNFFYQFPNCLTFTTSEEFTVCIRYAQEHEPEPLSPALRHMLSWEAATHRLVQMSQVTFGEARARRMRLDKLAWALHSQLGTGRHGKLLRKLLQVSETAQHAGYSHRLEENVHSVSSSSYSRPEVAASQP